ASSVGESDVTDRTLRRSDMLKGLDNNLADPVRFQRGRINVVGVTTTGPWPLVPQRVVRYDGAALVAHDEQLGAVLVHQIRLMRVHRTASGTPPDIPRSWPGRCPDRCGRDVRRGCLMRQVQVELMLQVREGTIERMRQQRIRRRVRTEYPDLVGDRISERVPGREVRLPRRVREVEDRCGRVVRTRLRRIQ